MMRSALPWLALLIACTPARQPDEALRIDVHPTLGAVISVFADGTIESRTLELGHRIFRYVPYDRRADPRAYTPARPSAHCPTRVTANQRLIVTYDEAVHVLDSRNGRLRRAIPHRPRGPIRACPATTPDGGVVIPIPSFHGSGRLLKIDVWGRDQFEIPLPDAGPVLASLEVDPRTGDILAITRTHVMNVSPDGRLNWIVEHRRRIP